MMAPADQDQELQVSVGHGLRVTYNENESSFTLDWDPETHPEYNYLEELSEDELTEHLLGALKEQIDEFETTLSTKNNGN
jgi:hypothetical protein